jgi:LPPG:FO 2-phospho-L-lactate transferase
MSNAPVRTRLLGPDGWLDFQEFFVRDRARTPVRAVRYEGAAAAQPAPGVLAAIADADAIVVCPSNPVTSIGPILAVPGVADALGRAHAPAVAVSPIVGGAAVSGPAGALMAATGRPVSAAGVARAYAPWLDILVADETDAGVGADVEAEGARCVTAPIVMKGPEDEAALARAVLGALR